MIGRLIGIAEQVGEGRCLVDVNGVGYVVFCSTRTLGNLPKPPVAAALLIETVVREDAITLYGFADSAERDWFLKLVTVQGVGPKLAMAVLSALLPDQLASVLLTNDIASLRKISGVGPNLAKRLATELNSYATAQPSKRPIMATTDNSHPQNVSSDAVSALLNLGYRRFEAEAAVAAASETLGISATLDALIRDGLKRLAR